MVEGYVEVRWDGGRCRHHIDKAVKDSQGVAAFLRGETAISTVWLRAALARGLAGNLEWTTDTYLVIPLENIVEVGATLMRFGLGPIGRGLIQGIIELDKAGCEGLDVPRPPELTTVVREES